MIKFSATSDWAFDIEPVSIVNSSNELTKRASCKDLLNFKKTAGQTDLHVIAVGAYEGTGPNRNGDAFSESDCVKNCHYFKDSDRAVHRHHKNKKNDPKYGNIKAAAYNPNMKRIELIIGLDNDKCADILDEQEKKGYINLSMACKQAFDVCSLCNHKAKTDTDRCEHIPSHIGEITKQGELIHMKNPDPRWFEISYVHRPADRIGMSLKLASDNKITPMLPKDFLKIYTGFEPPQDFLISKKASDKRQLLLKLAEMEKYLDAVAKKGPKTNKEIYLRNQAYKINKSKHIDKKDMDDLRKHEPKKVMKGMGDKGEVMNPDEFSNYLFGGRIKPDSLDGMKSHLPDIFSELNENPDEAAEVLNNESFEPESSNQTLPAELQHVLGKLFEGHSLFGSPASNRVMKITIEMGGSKDNSSLKPSVPKEQKSKEAFDKELAKVYTMYKLATLNYLQEQNSLDDEVLWNALIQNRA